MTVLSAGVALATAAHDLIGTPYRLHGRDPATGLDCIGLFVAAMAAIGRKPHITTHYGLRNTDFSRAAPVAGKAGLKEVSGPVKSGDVLMYRLSPVQAHVMIAGLSGVLIHAHAGLRRVVAMPMAGEGGLPGRLLHHWRLADQD